jgi:hypothetical protein
MTAGRKANLLPTAEIEAGSVAIKAYEQPRNRKMITRIGTGMPMNHKSTSGMRPRMERFSGRGVFMQSKVPAGIRIDNLTGLSGQL